MNSQHLMLIGMLITIIGLAFAVRKVKAGIATTFSLHAAQRNDTYIVFALSLTLSVICYYLYGVDYLIPKTGVPWIFTPVYLFLLVTIVVAGWIPETIGWKRRTHHIVVYSMIPVVPVLTFLISLANVSLITRATAIIGTIVALTLIYLYFFVKSTHRHILVYQGIYMVVLISVFMSATYL